MLTPLTGTAMGHLSPPPIDQVEEFFATARATMDDTKVNLGCGRPMGDMKVALDKAAVDHGFNGIAYPADGILDYAERSGLKLDLHEACCSVTWMDTDDVAQPDA